MAVVWNSREERETRAYLISTAPSFYLAERYIFLPTPRPTPTESPKESPLRPVMHEVRSDRKRCKLTALHILSAVLIKISCGELYTRPCPHLGIQ